MPQKKQYTAVPKQLSAKTYNQKKRENKGRRYHTHTRRCVSPTCTIRTCAVRREHAVVRVEPQGIPKHGLLMNVSGIRAGERKRMKKERLAGKGGGEEGADEGGIPEHMSSTKTDPF